MPVSRSVFSRPLRHPYSGPLRRVPSSTSTNTKFSNVNGVRERPLCSGCRRSCHPRGRPESA